MDFNDPIFQKNYSALQEFLVSESISYQGTALFQEIAEQIQVGMDYVDNNSHTMSVEKLDVKLKQLFKKTLMPKITASIRKHTGLNITKVVYAEHCSCMFATIMNFGDDATAQYIHQALSGDTLHGDDEDAEYQLSVMLTKDIEQDTFKDVQKNFDPIKGKANTTNFRLGGSRNEISSIMFFDHQAACGLPLFCHKSLQRMNAGESAAIVLHEVGHTVNLIERASDLCRAFHRCTAAVDLMVAQQDPKDIVETTRKTVKQNAERFFQPDDAKQFIRSMDDIADSSWFTWAKDKVSFLFRALVTTQLIIYNYGIILMSSTITADILELIHLHKRGNAKNKKNDTVTGAASYQMERAADIFATKHGAGPYLPSALEKITSAAMYNFIVPPVGDVISGNSTRTGHSRNSWYMFKMYQLFTIMQGIGGMSDMEVADPRYESINGRAASARTAILDSFRELPPSDPAVQELIQQFEHMERVIAESNQRTKIGRIWRRGFKFMRELFGSRGVISLGISIFTGKFNKELTMLERDLDTLKKNKAYYHAAKLDQLLKTED